MLFYAQCFEEVVHKADDVVCIREYAVKIASDYRLNFIAVNTVNNAEERAYKS